MGMKGINTAVFCSFSLEFCLGGDFEPRWAGNAS